MSPWPVVSIKDFARVVGGATPKSGTAEYWDGNIPWTTPKDLSDLDGKYLSDTPRKITASGLKSCSSELLPPNSVLFSSRAPIGHVAINTVPMATNQGFKSFIPSPKLDASFLFWWLKCHRAQLELLGNGATFKEVSKAIVERIEIPLPPLDEQKRIAAILDQADELRRKRQRAIDHLEQLGQAVFYEMFGDPVKNSRRWPVKRIGDISKVITGNTPPRLNPENFGDGIEWITSDNINTPSYYLTEAEERLSDIGKNLARTSPPESILVTCIAGSPDCIGNAAMADRTVAFNQQINAIIPTEGDAHYLYAVIRIGKRLVREASTGGMKGLVSKSRFENIKLPLAPKEDQREFGRRIVAIEDAKNAHKLSLGKMSELFASLQHRAFQGEL